MPDSPFTGLMPFTEEQAAFFFGREAEREIITANLLAARLTLLYGPSGAGAHATEEWVEIDSLERCARLYLDLARAICASTRL